MTVVRRRTASFGAKDPDLARAIGIREALVEGKLATKGGILAHNARQIADVAELEHKARRQDVLVDPETIAAFYAERLPQAVHTTAGFERWRVEAEQRDPKRLFITREALCAHAAAGVTEAQYPEILKMAGAQLPLRYRFAPGHPLDGLTLTVPLALLNQLDDARLSWLVPGMVREKVGWYFKALPKALRNRLVPLAEFVTAFLEDTTPGESPLPEAIRAWLKRRLNELPPSSAWNSAEMPAHLAVNVQVVDAAGKELAMDVTFRCQQQLGDAAQLTFAATGPAFERKGLKRWEFGDLPPTLTVVRSGARLTGYPALVDDGDSVSIALLDTSDAADRSTRAGAVRLIRFALADTSRAGKSRRPVSSRPRWR